MSIATLAITRNTHGHGTRTVIADCDHGRTTMVVMDGGPAAPVVTDLDAARIVALRLLVEEGCRCARRLARKYGVAS